MTKHDHDDMFFGFIDRGGSIHIASQVLTEYCTHRLFDDERTARAFVNDAKKSAEHLAMYKSILLATNVSRVM